MKPGSETELEAACDVLRAGGVVAAATESSFGLLVDARNHAALDRLFQVKARDVNRGVGLMVPSVQVWRSLVREPQPPLVHLAQRFWPGPLSIVANAAPELDPRLVVDGKVAVRVPGPSPAAQLVDRFGGAVTATSANLSGQAPCLTAQELRVQLAHALPWLHILEAAAPGGPPSTFVTWADDTSATTSSVSALNDAPDSTRHPATSSTNALSSGLIVLRMGALSIAQLAAALGDC